jgi:hypothetical protein
LDILLLLLFLRSFWTNPAEGSQTRVVLSTSINQASTLDIRYTHAAARESAPRLVATTGRRKDHPAVVTA